MRACPPFTPVLVACLALLNACTSETPTDPVTPESAHAPAAPAFEATRIQYGAPQRVGGGRARTYVVSAGPAHTPVEIGVALDARLLTRLDGVEAAALWLSLPPGAPAPYRFVMFDWNPQGHVPPGVYTVPHFDFHFYAVPTSEVESILPSDPQFSAKANNVPTGASVPPFYVVLSGPGLQPSDVAVPQMGVHWADVRSPELQGLFGNPGGYQPFTKTFIYGSWNGTFTFYEPMITRAYLLTQPHETIPIPQPASYPRPGWYPDSYSIRYDAIAREYRVALTGLSWHD